MLAEMHHDLELAGERADVGRVGGPSHHLHRDCGDRLALADPLRFRLHHYTEGAAAQLFP